jgi:hypothetical protein
MVTMQTYIHAFAEALPGPPGGACGKKEAKYQLFGSDIMTLSYQLLKTDAAA